MCVCMCVHVSTIQHTHTHVYIYIYICIYMCVLAFLNEYIYIYILYNIYIYVSYIDAKKIIVMPINTFPCQMDMHVCIQMRMEGCACFFNCLHFIIQLWRCFISRISSCYVEYDCLSSCDDMSNIQLLSLISCVTKMWCPLVADYDTYVVTTAYTLVTYFRNIIN